MEWKEFKIYIPPKATDLVALRLYEWGSNGSVIQDDDIDESGRICVIAYFPVEIDIEEKLKTELDKMQQNGSLGGTWSFKTDIANDEQWLYSWQKYFHVMKISPRFWVEPAWEKATLARDELVLKIDPGQSFGSGIHETTCMCIDFLEKDIKPGDYVIDIGTGTGILAIAAAKLGASVVMAVDNDAIAVDQAVINIDLNGVSSKVYAENSDLLSAVSKQNQNADVIVANIVADAIIALLPTLKDYLKRDGIFIASGIIDDRVEEVRQVAENNHFTCESEKERNGWFAIQMRWHP